MPPRNVCDIVVANDLCIGCGLCAGICPANVLVMQFNQFGEYIPVEHGDGCLPKCDLCLRTCPFNIHEENEATLAQAQYGAVDGIRHRPETGYYLDCYVGYSKVDDHRASGASGGLATWFLEKLLNDKIVDRVICVTPTNDPEKLFQFDILDGVDDVRRSGGSCYYPVEMGDVIRQVTATRARYAVTGLPCFLKGLRLTMGWNRRLRERIVAQIGLTCGQSKSKFFAEYAVALGGGDPHRLARVRFRIKDPGRPASDWGTDYEWLGFDGTCNRGMIFRTDGLGRAWRNGYFRPNACNYCDDLFAEVADMTFMDAWLPGYQDDPGGHSVVINRNPRFKALWDLELGDDCLKLDSLSVEQVIASQRSQLLDKRESMQYRCLLAQRDGKLVPPKRWPPQITGHFLEQWLWRLRQKTGRISRAVWAKDKDLASLRSALRYTDILLSILTPMHWALRAHQESRLGPLLTERLKW